MPILPSDVVPLPKHPAQVQERHTLGAWPFGRWPCMVCSDVVRRTLVVQATHIFWLAWHTLTLACSFQLLWKRFQHRYKDQTLLSLPQRWCWWWWLNTKGKARLFSGNFSWLQAWQTHWGHGHRTLVLIKSCNVKLVFVEEKGKKTWYNQFPASPVKMVSKGQYLFIFRPRAISPAS